MYECSNMDSKRNWKCIEHVVEEEKTLKMLNVQQRTVVAVVRETGLRQFLIEEAKKSNIRG